MTERLSIGSRLAMGGDRSVVAEYLAAGGDPNAVDSSRSVLFFAALGGGAGAVPMLLDHGADPRWADPITGSTALHIAVTRRDLAVARALLEAGSEIDAVDHSGTTPLLRCILSYPRGDHEILRLLLDHGASVDIANHYGITPRSLLARTPVLAQWIHRSGDEPRS